MGVNNPFSTIDPCFFTCVFIDDVGRLILLGGVANAFRIDVSGRCAFLVDEVGAVWIHLFGSGRNRGFYWVSSFTHPLAIAVHEKHKHAPCPSCLPSCVRAMSYCVVRRGATCQI